MLEPKKASARPPMGEIATTQDGRDITRPWIGPMMVSADRILQTKGSGDLDVYAPILTDDQVKSTLQQRFGAVVSREWTVDEGANDRKSRKAADFLREQLGNNRWDRTTAKMLSGVFWGHSVSELMYAKDGANIALANIKVRDRRRFRFNREAELRMLTTSAPLLGEKLPNQKFWTFSTGADHDDEPYGLGLAHWLYWPVFFKRNGVRFWLLAVEKFGGPTHVGKFPSNAKDEDIAKLLSAVEAIRTDSGVVIPDGMSIEQLLLGQGAGISQEKLVDKMDEAIAKVVLSQTMTTEDGSSNAQAQVHQGVADYVVKSDADLVCASFNNGPAKWLTEWNYPGATPPKVWRVMEDAEDLNTAAERDTKLYAMGYEPSEKRITDTYGEGYIKRETPPPSDPVVPANANGERGDDEADVLPAFAESHRSSIDAMLASMAESGEIQGAADAMFEPIAAALQSATSPADLKIKLDALDNGGLEMAPLIESLAAASFTARLAGELGAPISDEPE